LAAVEQDGWALQFVHDESLRQTLLLAE